MQPFSEEQILRWFVQLALALHHVHERGVLHFHKGEYSNAVRCFLQVAEGSPHHDDAAREPSVFNLGHAYRKLRDSIDAAPPSAENSARARPAPREPASAEIYPPQRPALAAANSQK